MRVRPRRLPRSTALLAIGLDAGYSLIFMMGSGTTGAARISTTAESTSSWTVYHGDAAGSGVSGSVRAVDTSSDAWTSPALDGQLYGEPLVSVGEVYVATEDDTVYALSSLTGAVIWFTHIASPVPASSLPCGDIAPYVG